MAKKKNNKKKTKSAKKANVRSTEQTWHKYAIIGVLLLTILSFIPIKDAEFVNWDDEDYVIENKHIKGLSGENIKTIFLAGVHPDYPDGLASNYHPLTMLSLAINHSMSGMKAWSYHWTNLLLHLVNVYLVFLLLGLLFGKKNVLLCAFGALVFAIHPMHVESVAWISERKDVLFTLFYLLALIAYLKNKTGQSKGLIMTFIFFLCSLLSKPAAVTFPVILVLIDLFRDGKIDIKKQLSKIPFFALSVVFGLITLNIQAEDAIGDIGSYSIIQRFSFGSFGLMHYLINFFAPLHPATFYPYPDADSIPTLIKIAPIGLIAFIGALGYFFRSSKWMILGFGFFVINLLLTLQFFQVGSSLVSDRYTYLSYIGLIIMLLYLLKQYVFGKNARFENLKNIVIGVLGLWSLVFIVLSFIQTQTWKNGETLWNNVADKFPTAAFPQEALGDYFLTKKEYEKAIPYFDNAKQGRSHTYNLMNKRGNTLRHLTRFEEAVVDLSAAIKIDPERADAYNNRGNVYVEQNKLSLALADYEKSISIDEQHADSHGNLGAYYFKTKEYDKALAQFDKFNELSPFESTGYLNKAAVYLTTSKYAESLENLELYLSKGGQKSGQFHYYKSLALERSGNLREALTEINNAIRFNLADRNYLDTKARIEQAMK